MYFWMAKWSKTGLLMCSKPFDSYDDCYQKYWQQMEAMARDGWALNEVVFRGIYDAERATELMTDHMQGEI